MTSAKHFVTTILSGPPGNPDEPALTISTAAPDRDGDRVIPEGGDLTAYRRNPTVLWAHLHSDLPIGACTGLEVLPGAGLRMRFRWLAGDPFAERVRNAWEQGIVRAASIGFLSHRSTRNEFGGLDHLAWELVEVSLVPVPANAEAVRTLHALKLWPSASGRAEEPVVVIEDDDADEALSLDTLLRALQARDADHQALRAAVRAALPGAVRAFIDDTLEPLAREAVMRHTGRVD